MKNKIFISAIVIATLNIAVIMLIIFSRDDDVLPTNFECVSETEIKKEVSANNFVNMKLTILAFLQNHNMTIIYKGSANDNERQYSLEHSIKLSLKHLGKSNMYRVSSRSVNSSRSNNTPNDFYKKMLLDDIDYFYIIKTKSDEYIINSLTAPMLVCSET